MQRKFRRSVRGQFPSPKSGTTMFFEGKTIYLPDKKSPAVIQKLTLDQIEAIPKDKYEVTVKEPIEPPIVFYVPTPGRTGRSARTLHRRCYHHRPLSRRDRRRHALHKVSMPGYDGTKEYTTIIRLIEEAKQRADKLYYTNRELTRNQKDAPPPDSGIFCPPIDEDKLSDCIIEIIIRLFGDNDKCKICSSEYKLVEFCMLMHYYFIRIGILENITRKPFCDYLENKVFQGNPRFAAKTFNNCANEQKFKKVEKDFPDTSRLKIDFNTRPESNGTLLAAFHEIGFLFHNSLYFNQLRELRNRSNTFRI